MNLSAESEVDFRAVAGAHAQRGKHPPRVLVPVTPQPSSIILIGFNGFCFFEASNWHRLLLPLRT